MMLPTHALAGMLLGLAAGYAVPEFAGVALVAGLLGGILPDLDMYVGHRRTLHYPVYYAAFASGTLVLASLLPSALTVGAAVLLLGAATHSVADVFGGGLELRPWEATSDRAVYDHYNSRWLEPRRWVRYDGSPGDLLLSTALSVPLVWNVEGVLEGVVAASLGVAVVYTALRRVLPAIADAILGSVLPALPRCVRTRVPERYLRSHSAAEQTTSR
ncbi:metal-dependent hydrolase [Haloarcula sp. JP-L23]|uniref:metal-dependent hydrolase n=1 Tax=Haloarcula sp. JP-L23 TaxID=2716717 RepID=UPI00140EA5FD|nr:metal-dependent hydrolase [Haloarcula sp. JP-L23]